MPKIILKNGEFVLKLQPVNLWTFWDTVYTWQATECWGCYKSLATVYVVHLRFLFADNNIIFSKRCRFLYGLHFVTPLHTNDFSRSSSQREEHVDKPVCGFLSLNGRKWPQLWVAFIVRQLPRRDRREIIDTSQTDSVGNYRLFAASPRTECLSAKWYPRTSMILIAHLQRTGIVIVSLPSYLQLATSEMWC